MNDYEALDLSTHVNTSLDQIDEGLRPTLGPASFHGLPFQVGDAAGNRILAFGVTSMPAPRPVTIPLGKTAHRVLLAHSLLESRLMEGEPVGAVVAVYRFHFTDEERIDVPIRERFEIAANRPEWGQMPFDALPDRKDYLHERYRGSWGQTGERQTEAGQGWPKDFYLWDWINPRPETAIDWIEVIPAAVMEGAANGAGRPLAFMIGGITLSHVEEDPFPRYPAVPVRVTLPRSEDAAPPFTLEVEVDRGVATYPYPLPEASADGFLENPLRGWGEATNRANSPAYTQITATPSATVSVKRNDEVLGSTRWGDLQSDGKVETERVRLEVVDTGRNWVHTTVLDDDTGRPIPCRVHFRSPEGIPFAPHGHHPHVNSNMGTWHIDVGGDVRLGQITYACIDGKCQGWLPCGEVLVDAARGYEYEPLRARVEILPGQRELTLRLRRHRHMNRERYFSGDTHVHFLSSQGALTEAAAEDLDVVNLLQSQWGHLFTNTEEFTGRPIVSGDGETIVHATQENRQHLLGHLTLLGLKEPVMPWCSDGPSEAELGGSLETTLSRWADACHEQGGTVVIPHMPNPNGEPAALIATGRADAVEMLVHGDFQHLEYYRYLNGGYRLPLAGGTDKMDSGVPVGLYRTYAHIPADDEFNYDNWLKALRSGNTFLSGGPLLRFTVENQPIGSEIALGRDGGTVDVEAEASSIFPIHTLQIVQGGRVVASADEERGSGSLRLRASLRIDGPTWLCARCAGPGYTAIPHHDSWGRGIMAHTSPVYITCGGEEPCDPATLLYMRTLVDGSLQHIRRRTRQWEPDRVTHHHSAPDHQAYLEEPFHQAAAALHRKLHERGIAH